MYVTLQGVARRAETKRTPLTRERVLSAAVGLADAEGIEALSMRRLGQELGVEAMSLYNHVAKKGPCTRYHSAGLTEDACTRINSW